MTEKREIPSITDIENQARMERDADRVQEQTADKGLKFEEDVQDVLVSIEESGVRDDVDDMAVIEHLGEQGESRRPTEKPRMKMFKRIRTECLDAGGNMVPGWGSEEVLAIPVDPNELTGNILGITINGITFINREKLVAPSWRDELDENYKKSYTANDKKKRSAEMITIRDNKQKARVTVKTFIDTNQVAYITWGGYTFVHQGWTYHNGVVPRDRRVMSLDDKMSGKFVEAIT